MHLLWINMKISKIKNWNTDLEKVHFVGLYCIKILEIKINKLCLCLR